MVGRARAPEGSALTLSEPDAALSEELAGGMVEGWFERTSICAVHGVVCSGWCASRCWRCEGAPWCTLAGR